MSIFYGNGYQPAYIRHAVKNERKICARKEIKCGILKVLTAVTLVFTEVLVCDTVQLRSQKCKQFLREFGNIFGVTSCRFICSVNKRTFGIHLRNNIASMFIIYNL